MKEITFSPEAIAAILAGTKTKTRRRMKNPPRWWEGHFIGYKVYPDRRGNSFGFGRYTEVICERDGGRQRRNPYGDPGDRLRIRGTQLMIEIRRVEIAEDARGAESRLEKRAWLLDFIKVSAARKAAIRS